jgi:multiple sugar transport system permease protein
LPIDPYESAQIDGASAWQSFWFITLPLLRPTIAVAAPFRVIDALESFDVTGTFDDFAARAAQRSRRNSRRR